MDQAHYEKMAANIPKARVTIDKSRWVRIFGYRVYLSTIVLGTVTFFVVGNKRIFNPYADRPTKTVYKAYPDYVNGTVSFYEKEVPNTISYL